MLWGVTWNTRTKHCGSGEPRSSIPPYNYHHIPCYSGYYPYDNHDISIYDHQPFIPWLGIYHHIPRIFPIYIYPIIDPFFPVTTGLKCPVNPKGSAASPWLFSQGSKTLSLAACRRHVQKTAVGSPWVTHRLGIHIWGVNRYGLRPLRPDLDNSKATTGRSKRVLPGPGGVHWCFVRRWSSLLYCESSRKVQSIIYLNGIRINCALCRTC
jgi:hypothetical protein